MSNARAAIQHFASRISAALPVTMRGDVVVSSPTERRGLSPEEALSHLQASLRNQRASEVERHGLELRFRVKSHRSVYRHNNLLLDPVDRGSVVVSEMPDGLRVSYDLSFRRAFVVSGCLVMFLGAIAVAGTWPKPHWRELFAGMLFGWLYVFGATYLIAAFRFPRFIRRVLLKQKGR